MRDLGRALLDNYAAAHELTASDFAERSFEWLRGHVPFDSGGVAAVTYSDGVVGYKSVRLHRQPLEKVLAYSEVAHLDCAAEAMLANAGSATACDISRDLPRSRRNEPMHRYIKRFGVAQCLNFCTDEGGSGDAVALWRGAERRPYEAAQIRLAGALAPHLILGLKINASRFLEAQDADAPKRRGGSALVASRDGSVAAFDERALRLMEREWPQWSPPKLPKELVDGLASSGAMRFVGRRLVADCALSGSAMVIRVRPSGASALTPAQSRVADALGRGHAYKRIALDLGVSPATVRNHAHAIYAKLGARSRAELAWLAACEAARPEAGSGRGS